MFKEDIDEDPIHETSNFTSKDCEVHRRIWRWDRRCIWKWQEREWYAIFRNRLRAIIRLTSIALVRAKEELLEQWLLVKLWFCFWYLRAWAMMVCMGRQWARLYSFVMPLVNQRKELVCWHFTTLWMVTLSVSSRWSVQHSMSSVTQQSFGIPQYIIIFVKWSLLSCTDYFKIWLEAVCLTCLMYVL